LVIRLSFYSLSFYLEGAVLGISCFLGGEVNGYPNLSGYFVSALKGDWGSTNVVNNSESEEVDEGAVFRHWYDLGKRLGYCSGQEIREGEQWVILSGSWESWESAVQRGYSLSYLKKIMSRNQGK